MIKVLTNDGEEFYGADAKEVVRQMKNTTWGPPQAKRDYMEQAANRAEGMTGEDVHGELGAARFLHDLEDAGLVRVTFETPKEETT